MIIGIGNSVEPDTDAALADAWEQLRESLTEEPSLVICTASAAYPAEKLRQGLTGLAPQSCRIAGSSSCLGAMNNHGFHSRDGYGLSLIGFADSRGGYGVGRTALADDPEAAGARAIDLAILDAGRPGELPDLIWIGAAPGMEEAVLDGIASVVGSDVPILGGSSGDNAIAGEWWQFSSTESGGNGVMVIAMYPSCRVGMSFHSGYAPTGICGRVTRADGRTIFTIDGRPAAEVYNEWTKGLIESSLSGGNILATTTFNPLGKEAGAVENIPYYALLHPELVLADGAISLFSNVENNDNLTLMYGSPDSLVSRAGAVVSGIIDRHGWKQEQVAGALVVYCAGCMLGVQERMDEVSAGIDRALDGAPFQGMFTFGEQGRFVDGISRHANLMISVAVFANRSI